MAAGKRGKEAIMEKKNSLNISAKSFLTAIVIIFLLMVVTYALTFLVPGGEYARTVDEAGHTIIDTQVGFRDVEGRSPPSRATGLRKRLSPPSRPPRTARPSPSTASPDT